MNQNGHLEIVELLLAKGANIEHVNHLGQTPLWIAAYVWIYCCFLLIEFVGVFFYSKIQI